MVVDCIECGGCCLFCGVLCEMLLCGDDWCGVVSVGSSCYCLVSVVFNLGLVGIYFFGCGLW